MEVSSSDETPSSMPKSTPSSTTETTIEAKNETQQSPTKMPMDTQEVKEEEIMIIEDKNEPPSPPKNTAQSSNLNKSKVGKSVEKIDKNLKLQMKMESDRKKQEEKV